MEISVQKIWEYRIEHHFFIELEGQVPGLSKGLEKGIQLCGITAIIPGDV